MTKQNKIMKLKQTVCGKGKRLTIESSLFVALDELKDRFFTAKFLLDQNMER
jgi:hypothetical protein